MGQYNKAIITTAGENMIARAVAGELKLNITKAKISNHRYTDGTDYKALTDMDGVKLVLDYPETKVLDNNMIQTRVLFSNEEIQDAYYIQNIGLYAKDSEEEILICIVTAEIPDEMPKYNGVASTSYIYNIQNVVQDAAEINIEVVTSGTATIQDVMERVGATGGNISETVLETLEPIDVKYPVPAAGETTKVFMGKVKKYMEDTKPLDKNMVVEVSPAGEDKPGGLGGDKIYKTIQYAVNTLPKNLNGKAALIALDAGTYDEDVVIEGFSNGKLSIQYSAGQTTLTTECSVKSIAVSYCDSVYINGFNFTTTSSGVTFTRCNYTEITYCQQNTTYSGLSAPSFNFNAVLYGRVYGCKSTGHDTCLKVMGSNIFSDNWDPTSSGNSFGYVIKDGGIVVKGGGFQPRGYENDEYIYQTAGIILNQFGARIGTLLSDLVLYVSPAGSDIIGNGSSSKPFATIQHAISILPKDLGGHACTINIADGSYSERLVINGFYGGRIKLVGSKPNEVSSVCNIPDITITDNSTLVDIRGINFTTTTANGIYAVVSSLVIVAFCRCVLASSWSGFSFDQTRFEVSSCVVANKGIALMAHGADGNSRTWDPLSVNNTVGIHAEYGSIIRKNGAQPQATAAPERCHSAGSIINENGTQISGLITSGLSCNWGTITGGYVRNGSLSGPAMVTIQVRVTASATVYADNEIWVVGFPRPASDTAITCSTGYTRTCWMSAADGYLRFTASGVINIGNILVFSCTYLTNS
ncbi:hypothetical protein [Lacrimispora sp.]|uniref:hypothetical protein n=1 Tax=Lacrimispora sp. TaxID=2719234 RepID=UPI0028ACCA59|nr:hypothetical protein [Lacrimispora sp.]